MMGPIGPPELPSGAVAKSHSASTASTEKTDVTPELLLPVLVAPVFSTKWLSPTKTCSWCRVMREPSTCRSPATVRLPLSVASPPTLSVPVTH
jgi:hypothetical protein